MHLEKIKPSKDGYAHAYRWRDNITGEPVSKWFYTFAEALDFAKGNIRILKVKNEH